MDNTVVGKIINELENTMKIQTQTFSAGVVAVLLFVVLAVAPLSAFADGKTNINSGTSGVMVNSGGSSPYGNSPVVYNTGGSNKPKPTYVSSYNGGNCNGNYNCNSVSNNYGSSYSSGYGGYYGGSSCYYGCGSSGYGGNTYVLGLSYRGSDRTVINNTNTNTNVNNNGGYVPRHTVHYGDDDDDNDDEDYDAPRCELDASDTSVDDGDRITLEWNTDGDIDEAYINNGIGDVDEDGGDETIRVTRDVTFRMTVRGPGGSDSCSVSIRVDEDNNDNNSNVTLLSEPTDNQLTSVYLSDLPYTGTEDTIVVGSIIATLLALMGGAWYFMFKKSLPAIAASTSMPVVPVLSQVMESTAVAPENATATVKHPATVDVHAFVEALIAGNHAEAAEILEAEVAEGMSAKMFMIRAKNALNAVVQSRDGEFVSPDAKVLDMTAELSTDTIKSIVSTLGQAIIARTA